VEQPSFFKSIYGEEVYSIAPAVTVIIGVPWIEVKEDQRQLLSKILVAIGQSIESVRILHSAQFDLSAYHEKPSRIIAFVAAPKGLATYEVVQTGQTSVIFSDPLESLISDDGSKRQLWNTLKTLFS
jgi:hypothetical protein